MADEAVATFSIVRFNHGAHVVASAEIDGHALSGYWCWCLPRVTIPCSQCGGLSGREDCWKCDGDGWVNVPAEDAELDGAFAVIIHNEDGCNG